METDQPIGLPYTGRSPQQGHPWEQPGEQPPQPQPQHPPQREGLPATPPGEHGSLAGSGWQQRAGVATPLTKLIGVEFYKLVATTSERVLLAVAAFVLLLVSGLAAVLVNQGGPDAPAYQVFGLVLACHLGPVPLYAVVLRSLSSEWYYRSVEVTLLFHPSRGRNFLAALVVLFSLWPAVSLAQFGVHLAAKPALFGMALWVLAIALLGGLLSMLLVLAVGLLIPNPTVAALVYVLVSVGYVVRVQNPLYLRWFDPWQPASLVAGSVPEVLPSLTSAAILLGAVGIGFALASRR